MNTVTQLVVALVPGVVVAVITALVTVRLSAKQFRSERWWERKAEAYSTIVGALYKAKAYAEAEMRACERETELSEEAKERLGALSTEGWEEIRRATSIGAFVISDEAAECLRELQVERGKAQTRNVNVWYERLDVDVFALGKCMDRMRGCAKRDLNVH